MDIRSFIVAAFGCLTPSVVASKTTLVVGEYRMHYPVPPTGYTWSWAEIADHKIYPWFKRLSRDQVRSLGKKGYRFSKIELESTGWGQDVRTR